MVLCWEGLTVFEDPLVDELDVLPDVELVVAVPVVEFVEAATAVCATPAMRPTVTAPAAAATP